MCAEYDMSFFLVMMISSRVCTKIKTKKNHPTHKTIIVILHRLNNLKTIVKEKMKKVRIKRKRN